MLSSISLGSRLFTSKHLPDVDLRTVISVGDKVAVRQHVTKISTTNRTALPGDEVMRTSRIMSNVEAITANMIEINTDKNHQSVGFYFDIKHKKPAYLGEELIISAQVKEVTAKNATFEAIIKKRQTDEVIAECIHKRTLRKFS